MIFKHHIPAPPLSDFVAMIWYFEGSAMAHTKERVLPNGGMELLINLHEDLIRSYDNHDPDRYETLSGSILAGTRSEYTIIDTACQSSILGVAFKPGGAFPFFGLPMSEVHGIDLSLDDLWGSHAVDLREQLLAAPTLEARFTIIERALLARASRSLERHPAVEYTLRQLDMVPQSRSLAAITDEIGLSQRRFIQLFREEVGMPPKLYYRIRRFQEGLGRIASGGDLTWIDLALSCGYYDQAHFIHDFRAFSGINPSTYRAQRGHHQNHIPLDP